MKEEIEEKEIIDMKQNNQEKNKGNQKYIFLNTRRPTLNVLSSDAKQNHYLIGSKVCYGDFVVYSSQDEVKPFFRQELNEDELDIKDIKPIVNLNNIYFPICLRDKIGNSRKKGANEVIATIEDIVDNYGDYLNLFKEKELYGIISEFFILVYNEMLRLNKEKEFKINFSSVYQVKPIYDILNSEPLDSCYYLTNEFLKYINNNNNKINNIFNNLLNNIGLLYTIDFNIKEVSEVHSIRSYIYNMFYTFGLPYIMNSELGDTIHLKNDFLANCYDSFFKIGILMEMIKRINYPINEDTCKEVLSLTNLPSNMTKYRLYDILEDCIKSEYEFISKVTSIDVKEVTINIGTYNKKATSTNNILDFYYHYCFNHLEDGTLEKIQKELTKRQESKNIRKMFENKCYMQKDEKKRNKMLKEINEQKDWYLKQKLNQRIKYREEHSSTKQ